MNCANHADASAVAYCRTCGKALCANCTRPVRGVIYCEDCLGSKWKAFRRGLPPALLLVCGICSRRSSGDAGSAWSGAGRHAQQRTEPGVAGILADSFPA